MKSSSSYSLARILSTSSTIFIWNQALATVSCTFCQPHLPKDVWTCQFFTILMLNRALATVSCAFCRPHLPKVVRDCQFLQFYVNSSSRYSLAHILSTTFRIEARTCGSRDPPAATTDCHFTLKSNIGFRARKCFQPSIHTLPIARASQRLHDDVGGMMVCFSWWCGWHDGATAGCDNRS